MGPKKEKLTKAQKLALKQAAEEQRRLEEEIARKEAEEAELLRLERERLHQEELERIRIEESEIREKEIAVLSPFLNAIKEEYHKNRITAWNELQWYQYVNVWHKINPLSLPMVNAFLSDWEDNQDTDPNVFFSKFHQSLKIISAIETALINCPELDGKTNLLWNEGQTNIKSMINKKVDLLSYLFFKNATDHLSSDSYNTEYGITDLEQNDSSKKSPELTLCLWANFAKNFRYKGMELRNLGVSFRLPSSLVTKSCAVRFLHMVLDTVTTKDTETAARKIYVEGSLSGDMDSEKNPDNSPSSYFGKEPKQSVHLEDSFNRNASAMGHSITTSQTQSYPDISSSDVFPASETSTAADTADTNNLTSSLTSSPPSTSDFKSKGTESFYDLEDTDIQYLSSDEYFVVGGILFIDLVEIPSQPVDTGRWILVYSEEKSLKRLPYKTSIRPIQPPDVDMSPAEAAEFSDAEIKRFDREVATAISVSFRLPNIVFPEKPQPAFWVENSKCFATNGIFDVNFEDVVQLSFKINQFGTIALMQKKYANFPLQAWQLMRHESDESILLTLTGQLLTVTIKITSDGCCIQLISIDNAAVLQDFYNVYSSPELLIKKLQSFGINIEFLTAGSEYIGFPSKVDSVENLAYCCIAVLCQSFAFTSNIQNKHLSAEELVFYTQENRFQENEKRLVLVNTERAVFVADDEINGEKLQLHPIPSQKFSSNLYHLLTQEFNDSQLKEIQDCDVNLITHVQEMLQICKIFSCS